MKRSTPKKRITIDLERFHVEGLQQLRGLIPHETEEELLRVVISRGLVAMLAGEFERNLPSASEVSHNMMATRERVQELRSKNAVAASKLRSSAQRMEPGMSVPGTAGPAPFGMKQSLDELHVQEAERDREMARMNRDLSLAETPEGDHSLGRLVENFIAVPLSQGLRRGLQSLMNAYPDVEEENLFTALLELGIKRVQEDPKTLRPWAAAQDAGLPLGSKSARRQLRAEWRLLCQNVARGWR
jgi:hypothetical protein